jgi:hypothetical protein
MDKFKKHKRDFPMQIKIGLGKIFDFYREQFSSQEDPIKWTDEILELESKFPELRSGIESLEKLHEYGPQIDKILQPLFPTVLGNNEIKFATVPFHDVAFKSSPRYKEIMRAAGREFYPDLGEIDVDRFYILGCSLILDHFYNKKFDFKRNFYYDIPDEQGMIRNYRVDYNTDFITIEKTAKAPQVTEEDFDELLENYNNAAVWKKKFPPESYIFNGFVIANLIDLTSDVSISDFKSNLLRLELDNGFENTDFTRIFRSILGVKDLKVGFSDYNYESESFECMLFKEVKSYLLNGERCQMSKDALCGMSYDTLFNQKEFYVVTDVERYHKKYPENLLYKKLWEQGLQSAIFASIISNNRILGVLELVAPNANDLNTINANKLNDILPFLTESIARSKENFENELELIIQEECTAIHNSVHWKFRNEAKRYLLSTTEGNPTLFREIVFKDVYPLFGQIDIRGSSEARNEATQKDLTEQLQYVAGLVQEINALDPMPIFEQMTFSIQGFLDELKDNLQVDTERKIITFLSSEIIPFFRHLSRSNVKFKSLISDYNELIDTNTGLVYKHRKDYDETVMQANKIFAGVLDRKQQLAQRMFPHYFERYKTDGVEHDLYIGASITNEKAFDIIYLKNLRLWQLQVMCEMENDFYYYKQHLPVKLEVASMILVFNGSLSLRFRLDEKRFDVDGTYNARYEVVKKRVDKANVRGTEERVTQPGKITIVYSQKEDEEEYLTYIRFLQFRKQLDSDVEMVELEDLQGVTGLKAIRVSVLYAENKKKDKKYYTYEDLISEIN